MTCAASALKHKRAQETVMILSKIATETSINVADSASPRFPNECTPRTPVRNGTSSEPPAEHHSAEGMHMDDGEHNAFPGSNIANGLVEKQSSAVPPSENAAENPANGDTRSLEMDTKMEGSGAITNMLHVDGSDDHTDDRPSTL